MSGPMQTINFTKIVVPELNVLNFSKSDPGNSSFDTSSVEYQHENKTEIFKEKSNSQTYDKTINDFKYETPEALQSYI